MQIVRDLGFTFGAANLIHGSSEKSASQGIIASVASLVQQTRVFGDRVHLCYTDTRSLDQGCQPASMKPGQEPGRESLVQ